MTMTATMPKISRGFTLVELMVVVAIMAVLASSAMPLQELIVKREKEQELRVALRQIRSAIDAYKQAVDDGRIEIKEEESGYPPSLEDLYMGVPDIKGAGSGGATGATGTETGAAPTATAAPAPATATAATGTTETKYIYFLRRLPRDPTFKDLDVAGVETTDAADTWGKRSYESTPENPQAGKDVFDVYSLSEGKALNGSLYKDW